MLRRFVVTSLAALTMVFGIATLASAGMTPAPSPEPSGGTCEAAAESPTYTPATAGSESAHPCDTACECCGQWNVEACCDKCWSCWYGGG